MSCVVNDVGFTCIKWDNIASCYVLVYQRLAWFAIITGNIYVAAVCVQGMCMVITLCEL